MQTPSLRSHYEVSSLLRVAPPLSFASVLSVSRVFRLHLFPYHQRIGSHVPNRSLCRVHAASMPATIWTVNRFPPDLSRANDDLPVLMTSLRFRHFYSGSRLFVSIGTHLTKSSFAFSVTLTTMAFYHSSLRWFEASACTAAPRGLPSSSVKHSSRTV